VCTAIVVICTVPPAILTHFSPEQSASVLRLPAITLGLVFVLSVLEFSLIGFAVQTGVFLAAAVTSGAALVVSATLHTRAPIRAMVYVLLTALCLMIPVVTATFDTVNGILTTTVGTLDFAGCLTVGVCASAVALVGMRAKGSGSPPELANRGGWAPTILRAAALLVGIGAWEVGSELVIDDISGTLVANQVAAAIAGALGWGIAVLLGARRYPARRCDGGVLAGSIAILPCSPWLDVPAAVVIAAAAGALCSVILQRSFGGRDTERAVLATVLIPAALGMIAAGIAANPIGLLYSGHADLLAAQLVGLGIVAIASFAGSWLILVVVFARHTPPVVGDAGLEPTTSSV
jgi:ammonia channel protein AmtB